MTINIKSNVQYDETIAKVVEIRDCIEGENTIKSKRTLYLKHPNMIDQASVYQLARYNAYIDGAEFKDSGASTEKSMIGKMMEGKIEIDLPDKIAYLEQNSDGDGMSLKGTVEILYKNLAEVKYHILVAEYDGLLDVETKSLSRADVKKLNLKSSIKHYSREALIDWDFRRSNGVLQLSLMVLQEESTERNNDTLEIECVKSWLILGLDDEGFYYQQKVVEANGLMQSDGDRIYPEASGEKLKWIPAEIVVDEELPAGQIPKGFGYLAPICASDLYSYRVSADYKEALHFFGPTLFTGGWKDGDFESFKVMNGRDYIAFGIGVSNNLPDGVTAEVVGSGVQLDPFERYFEINERNAKAMGAKTSDDSSQAPTTATQSSIENSQKTAVCHMIANNVEAALKRIISYCAMYEGLWSPDEVEENLDQIVLVLPREFSKSKLTPEEQGAIRENFVAGLISKDEAVKLLVQGGATVSDAESILKEIESQGPQPVQGAQLPATGQAVQ